MCVRVSVCVRKREGEREKESDRERKRGGDSKYTIDTFTSTTDEALFKHIIKTHRNFKIVRVCVSAFKRQRERERLNITH